VLSVHGDALPNEFTLNWPGRLVFGQGRLADLGEHAKGLGTHALLVTTRDLATLGLSARAETLLRSAGVAVTVFADVKPDPVCEDVDTAAVEARAARVDLVVALGGGSAIDFAKGLCAAVTHWGPIWGYVNYTGARARPLDAAPLPLIAVPTTAGTGSEVSQGSVLDNPRLEMKAALLSPRLYPRIAIVDPELTLTLPPKVTALTGFDALTHGIESFLTVQKSNPGSELFALEAVRRAARNLPRVLEDGADREGRAQMCWAASCGGMAIGLSNAGVAHAMALPVGARLGAAHGLALSLLQPVVLARTWEAQPERCAVLADAVGACPPDAPMIRKAESFARWIKDFVRRIGLAGIWQGQGIDAAMLDRLANDVFAYMGRPVSQYLPVFTREQVRAMLAEALSP
jgi:alcohol dehydrogenase class IV